MKQFSILIILILAFNSVTLNSTQEKRLPEIRFLKAEKGKYGDDVIYYFRLFKNNVDTSLYFSSTGSLDGSNYGLGYYETTKDASTNFFFNYLRKGTYVFEYPLFVTHAGNFSNGITTIQSMYAPEFTAHSEGVRITVE